MALKTFTVDGGGSGVIQKVFPDGASFSTSTLIPPFGSKWPVAPLVTELKNSAGSSDMRVAGSLTIPLDFFVGAAEGADRYITAISFLIADAGANLNDFGAVTALTNGCLLFYESQSRSVQILPALRSNFDFIRMSLGNPAIGDGGTVFQAPNAVGAQEAYMPVIQFSETLPPFGLKLDAGSSSRIVMKIQDNTTAVDAFNAIVFGFDRFPDT